MKLSKMSKFVIEEQSVDSLSLKENYNKVLFQKQMLVAQTESFKKMETAKTIDSKESPGLVRRRIMEMSSLLNASSPPPTTNNLIRPLKRTSSPARHYFPSDQGQLRTNPNIKTDFRLQGNINISPPPCSNNNIFLGPKPFKSLEPRLERCRSTEEPRETYQHQQQQPMNNTLHPGNNVSTGVKQQRSVSFKSCTALTELAEYTEQDRERDCSSPPAPPIPKRSASLPRNAHKPAIPPKPRNIAMKMSPTKSEEDPCENHWNSHPMQQQQQQQYIQHQQQQQLQQQQQQYIQHQQHQQQNRRNSQENANHNRYRSEEEDKVFETLRNQSFTSPEQHRLEMLKRRQSYSEFEDLIEKKRELRERMLSKIMLLREERDLLAMEKLENDSFGQGITCLLEHYASPQEISRYHQFLEEIEQITKLTVGLTIRLGRLNRKIESGTKSREEMMALERKKAKLEEQTREAEFLQQNTDRRMKVARNMLAKYLNDDELVQYDAFLVNLIKYITELKETEQRIQLGEEQLVALNDNLNISS